MALKIWLPLNGDLKNIGTDRSAQVTNTNAVVNNSGKIGKCYSFGTGASGLALPASAMQNFGEECSLSLWVNILSWNTAYATLFQAGPNAYAWKDYIFGVLRNNNGSNLCFSISDGTTGSAANYITSALDLNKWYNLIFTYKTGECKIYINGELDKKYSPTIVPNFSAITNISIGRSNKASYQSNCLMNDVRIYDHCLSALEVKEISQGLILHYKLDAYDRNIKDNLFLKTKMTPSDRSGWVQSSSTNFTKLIRFYNGTAGIHSFTALSSGEYEDTVTLNATGNLGLAFVRKATDINLDSNSYYTLSCEAKCNVTGKSLAIGTSYYKTNNTWLWRGGQNAVAFSDVDTWQTFSLTFKPDSDTQYICYCFTVNQGTANSEQKFTIRHCKLEKGSIATAWMPARDEDGVNLELPMGDIIDSSGYGNNGTLSGTATLSIQDDPRYGKSIFLNNGTATTGNNYILTPSGSFNWYDFKQGTITGWICPTASKTSYSGSLGVSHDGGSNAITWSISNYGDALTGNTANGNYVNNKSSGSLPLNKWNFIAGTLDGTTEKLYLNGELVGTYSITWPSSPEARTDYRFQCGVDLPGSNETFTGYYSDVRFYATALSAEDIATLYHTPTHVDNTGKFHSFEFSENGGNSIGKNGITNNSEIIEVGIPSCQYDSQIYTEPDGSKWIHIYHINNPGAGSFASTDSFATGVYKDANRWFDATRVCNQLNKWEFMVKYAFTSGGTEYKERWIQSKNPENAVFGDVDAADITRITTSGYKAGTWGGLYKNNASAYWVMNNGNSGNWWGATGGFSVYQSGTPGYGGTVTTTGYNDLYVRVDNIQTNARITKIGNYIGSGFIEK